MEIDFLELLEFVELKNKSNEYSEFLKFVEEVKNNPDQDFEISIPQELIDDFIEYKSNVKSN